VRGLDRGGAAGPRARWAGSEARVFAVGTSEFLLGPVGTTPGQSDVETFASADCKKNPSGRTIRCRNSSKSSVSFAKRSGLQGGYRVTLQVVGQQLVLPPVASTPLRVILRAPSIPFTIADNLGGCQPIASSTGILCRQSP